MYPKIIKCFQISICIFSSFPVYMLGAGLKEFRHFIYRQPEIWDQHHLQMGQIQKEPVIKSLSFPYLPVVMEKLI